MDTGMVKKRFGSLLLVALLVSTFGISVGKAFAIDEVFYSGNDILYFNPDEKACTSTSIATSGDAAGNAFNFLVSKGLNGLQSAAVLGNLQQESGINPKALNSGSGAYGIAQWLGGRKTKLLAKPFYNEANPDPAKEMQVQLEYLWEELQGSEKGSLDALKSASTTNVRELAVIFGEAFERYGPNEEGKRAEYAENFSKQFGNTSTSTGGECGVPAGEFVYYSQMDPKWGSKPYGAAGNIAEAGCGPTSLAMIIATLKDKSVTPDQVAEAGAANGSAGANVGTYHGPLLEAAKKKWGIQYQDMSSAPIDIIIQKVKEGNLIYMGGKGPAPFTAGGHIVVLRGVTPEGKLVIGDPYRNGADVYDPSVIDAYRGVAYSITK